LAIVLNYLKKISPDVSEQAPHGQSEYCKEYCGYHANFNLPSGHELYYLIGGIPSEHCRCNIERGPNNSDGLDGMFNYLALNLVNTVTNPNADLYPAWTDRKGYEAGHKCVSF
jgi:hypothetical protein